MSLLLQFHVFISLVAIFAGLVVVWGLLTERPLPGWTAFFLATTVLTSLTGFPLEPFGLTPGRIVGIISIVLLAVAIASLYAFHLAGAWRWIYIATAVASLWLNVFVGITQAFQKLPFLHALAPTGSEPLFLIVQLAALAILIVCAIVASVRFHPVAKPAA